MKKTINFILALTLAAGLSSCSKARRDEPPEENSLISDVFAELFEESSSESEISVSDSYQENSIEESSMLKTEESENSSETEETSDENSEDEKQQAQESRVLVAYFTNVQTDKTDADASASRVYRNDNIVGVTEYFAQIIAEHTNGDLFEIKGNDYPADYKSTTEAAKDEYDNDVRPELKNHIENLDDYDVIFVGYPTWWTDMPMAVYSFFDEYDLSGKTVVPFNTHWGYGAADTFNTIAEMEENAEVLGGLSVYNYDVEKSEDSISEWLDGIGLNL